MRTSPGIQMAVLRMIVSIQLTSNDYFYSLTPQIKSNLIVQESLYFLLPPSRGVAKQQSQQVKDARENVESIIYTKSSRRGFSFGGKTQSLLPLLTSTNLTLGISHPERSSSPSMESRSCRATSPSAYCISMIVENCLII
jgi:hypothetical protein